jgi:hypothetical protein
MTCTGNIFYQFFFWTPLVLALSALASTAGLAESTHWKWLGTAVFFSLLLKGVFPENILIILISFF